jgi:diguanylate cyclase (GGDEF)-like protein
VLALGLTRPLLALPPDLLNVLSLLVGETARLPAPSAADPEAQPRLTDDATGLLARAAGEIALNLEVERSTRNGTPLGLALIDLDRFKDYTATRGRALADELVTRTAEALGDQLRKDDILIQWDAATFLLVLPGCHQADVERAARQMRGRIPMGHSASVGFTMHCAEETAQQSLGRAESALHRAKRLGRNRSLAVYAPRRVPAPRRSNDALQAVG